MRILILILLFPLLSFGQDVPFGAKRIQDTSATLGALKVEGKVKIPFYGTSDTTLVAGWDINGYIIPRHKGSISTNLYNSDGTITDQVRKVNGNNNSIEWDSFRTEKCIDSAGNVLLNISPDGISLGDTNIGAYIHINRTAGGALDIIGANGGIVFVGNITAESTIELPNNAGYNLQIDNLANTDTTMFLAPDASGKVVKRKVPSSGGGGGTVTSVTAGAGLSGGTITTTGTISMPNTGTANTYAYPSQVITDAQGRVTSVTAGSAPLGTSLTNDNFWMGNGSNMATAVKMSGNATMTNTGVITVSLAAICTTIPNLTQDVTSIGNAITIANTATGGNHIVTAINTGSGVINDANILDATYWYEKMPGMKFVNKTANYTAAANEYVLVNSTASIDTIKLPNNPPDSTAFGIKVLVFVNSVVALCQGTDTINVAGGSTFGTLKLTGQGNIYRYQKSTHLWIATGSDFPLSQLDLRYAGINSTVGGDFTGTLPNPTLNPSSNISWNSHKITSLTDPTGAQDAATKNYVDNAVAGVNPAVAVQAATTAAIANVTYNNGASGIGATLTQTVAAVVVVDGYTLLLNDRVLIKDQATVANNGIFTITTLGTGVINAVFTRALDYDQPSDMNSTGAIPVLNGTDITGNKNTSWILTTKITNVGTDAVTFTKYSFSPTQQITGITLNTPNVIFGTPVTSTTASNQASLTLALNSQTAWTLFGNNTSGSATPTFSVPLLASGLFQNQGTTTQVLHGNGSGNPSWSAVSLTADVSGNLSVTNLNSGTSASSSTFWAGDGTWRVPIVAGSTVVSSATNNTIMYVNGSGVVSTNSNLGYDGNHIKTEGVTATGATGTGKWVFDGSPTLVTPTLGVSTATSINKVSITTPATGSTLTIADGKTCTVSNTLTLTGTDGSSVNFGAGGTMERIIAQSGAASTNFSGSTSETNLAIVTVPAGIMNANGKLKVDVLWVYTGTAGAKTYNLRVSTVSGATTGGTNYSNNSFAASTLSAYVRDVCIWNANSTSSQVGFAQASTTVGTSTLTVQTSTINTSNVFYLNINGILANSADAMQVLGYTVTLINP